ncbi:transcriptional repressor WHI5 KNAG_0L02050 [Huiozyma naganishii CBS 8797]|uniref:Uncharacterized protein n=1 Tax=Huiozyma naganishii (strain ATCC MYA-139 / BCRC 22969 / CBS 8797 / KCTC 17520 / NBRC 10181 / NCYC 3082 / Yp74L-3) TaxID=1071383 RepID=J7RSC7_HUIN7|nr:hypothetical protein KNAG_0L02050 [Kazachstania naganishii CBS 8797]CCK72823.1 hypothetical protein KNAG_0L02050 [Kazachstania naganishii CBS 8797]
MSEDIRGVHASGSGEDVATTPKRESRRKRLSVGFVHRSPGSDDDGDDGDGDDGDGYLATPSPPAGSSRARRSSTSLGFLATPRTEGRHSQAAHHRAISATFTSPRARSLLPPTTPKSRNTEVFLSPSQLQEQLKSPSHSNQGSVSKDNKPIKELSHNLKTRLSYAFVKLQNGWVDKTLPELENELTQHAYNKAAILTSPQRISPSRQTGPPVAAASPTTKYVNKFASSQEEAGPSGDARATEGTEAHLAFLQALSPSLRQSRGGEPAHSESGTPSRDRLNVSPIRWTGRAPTPALSKAKPAPSSVSDPRGKTSGQADEVDVVAVETLMSLSSTQQLAPPTRIADKPTRGDETEVETDSE